MDDPSDEAAPEASAAASPEANAQELRAQPADAILGPVPVKMVKEGSARKPPPVFERLSGYARHAVLAACAFGLAWPAGLYFFGGQSPFFALKTPSVALQESSERAELLRTVQKMAEEFRVLKSNVEAIHAAQGLRAKDAASRQGLKTRLDAVQTETGAAIAELAAKVEHMQRESAAKLSQMSERFDRMDQKIEAPRAAAQVVASASGAAPARKHARGGRGDAFDPAQNPTAPGAPRPLGSLAPAASASPMSENASAQRTN